MTAYICTTSAIFAINAVINAYAKDKRGARIDLVVGTALAAWGCALLLR